VVIIVDVIVAARSGNAAVSDDCAHGM